MKKTTLSLCLAYLLFASCNEQKPKTEEKSSSDTSSTTATETSSTEKKEWVPVDSVEGMKAYIAYATPGEEQKELAKWDGKWSGEATYWMYKNGSPTTSKLEETNKMIMDGRYQMATVKGDMMGMPFEGTSITGYDNSLKKYTMVWVDNMGTGILKMEGTRDEATKSLNLTGIWKNPANGMDCEMKQVITDVDDNTQKFEMYGPDPKTGEQYKTMEIVLKRRK